MRTSVPTFVKDKLRPPKSGPHLGPGLLPPSHIPGSPQCHPTAGVKVPRTPQVPRMVMVPLTAPNGLCSYQSITLILTGCCPFLSTSYLLP